MNKVEEYKIENCVCECKHTLFGMSKHSMFLIEFHAYFARAIFPFTPCARVRVGNMRKRPH